MTSNLKKRIWIVTLILSLAVVSYPRFNLQDIGPIKDLVGKKDGVRSMGDAPFYTNYVEFFRGKSTLEFTHAPFSFRPVAPLLASILPVESSMTALNIINLLFLYIGLLYLFRLMRLLGFNFNEASLGCLLYSVSFPMFYYSTTGCIDAVAMGIIAVGTYLVYREKWLYLILVLIVGSAVKEVTILVIPVAFGHLLFHRGRWFVIPALLVVVFVVPTIIVRWLVSDGSVYYWSMTTETLFDNLRFRAIASLVLSFGLTGVLSLGFAARYRNLRTTLDQKQLGGLVFGIAFTLILVVYSMLAAYTDGRFIWPLTIFSMPLALWFIRSVRSGRHVEERSAT